MARRQLPRHHTYTQDQGVTFHPTRKVPLTRGSSMIRKKNQPTTDHTSQDRTSPLPKHISLLAKTNTDNSSPYSRTSNGGIIAARHSRMHMKLPSNKTLEFQQLEMIRETDSVTTIWLKVRALILAQIQGLNRFF